jgi:pimeloyl-ACP methyl ester carboxylesterase
MSAWNLNDRVETRFGTIAAGHTGDGPALLLAHGWPWSSYSWHRIIPQLAQHFTCYWFDMLGYGRSDMPADRPTSLDIQGELQAEMIAHWGLDRPAVFAHDFGGATSLRSHLIGKVDFERIVLMNVVAINPWGSDFFDHVGKHVDAFAGLPANIHEAVVRAYIDGAMVQDIGNEDTEQLARPWLTDAGRMSFYRQFAMADETLTAELFPLYPEMRCPVSILWGEDDPWIPIQRGRTLHQAVPGSIFKKLPGLGHLPQLEDPGAVLAASGFLPD